MNLRLPEQTKNIDGVSEISNELFSSFELCIHEIICAYFLWSLISTNTLFKTVTQKFELNSVPKKNKIKNVSQVRIEPGASRM